MRILITGKNGYIAKNLIVQLLKSQNFDVNTIDLKESNWREIELSRFDAVVHLAAIVHRNKNDVNWQTYYETNSLLTLELASLAKKAGVKHFVFLSTMAVYGVDKKLPDGNTVTIQSPLKPNSFYARSKLEAEILLDRLKDDNFKISIVRPPNIFGKNSPGNYFKILIKVSKYSKIFPIVFSKSKQSLLYVNSLTKLIEIILEKKIIGVIIPQDISPKSTLEIISEISKIVGNNIHFSKNFGKLISRFYKCNFIIKAFGGVSYDSKIIFKDFGEFHQSFEEQLRESI